MISRGSLLPSSFRRSLFFFLFSAARGQTCSVGDGGIVAAEDFPAVAVFSGATEMMTGGAAEKMGSQSTQHRDSGENNTDFSADKSTEANVKFAERVNIDFKSS